MKNIGVKVLITNQIIWNSKEQKTKKQVITNTRAINAKTRQRGGGGHKKILNDSAESTGFMKKFRNFQDHRETPYKSLQRTLSGRVQRQGVVQAGAEQYRRRSGGGGENERKFDDEKGLITNKKIETKKSPKSTPLADNTQGLITTKKKPRPVASAE